MSSKSNKRKNSRRDSSSGSEMSGDEEERKHSRPPPRQRATTSRAKPVVSESESESESESQASQPLASSSAASNSRRTQETLTVDNIDNDDMLRLIQHSSRCYTTHKDLMALVIVHVAMAATEAGQYEKEYSDNGNFINYTKYGYMFKDPNRISISRTIKKLREILKEVDVWDKWFQAITVKYRMPLNTFVVYARNVSYNIPRTCHQRRSRIMVLIKYMEGLDGSPMLASNRVLSEAVYYEAFSYLLISITRWKLIRVLDAADRYFHDGLGRDRTFSGQLKRWKKLHAFDRFLDEEHQNLLTDIVLPTGFVDIKHALRGIPVEEELTVTVVDKISENMQNAIMNILDREAPVHAPIPPAVGLVLSLDLHALKFSNSVKLSDEDCSVLEWYKMVVVDMMFIREMDEAFRSEIKLGKLDSDAIFIQPARALSSAADKWLLSNAITGIAIESHGVNISTTVKKLYKYMKDKGYTERTHNAMTLVERLTVCSFEDVVELVQLVNACIDTAYARLLSNKIGSHDIRGLVHGYLGDRLSAVQTRLNGNQTQSNFAGDDSNNMEVTDEGGGSQHTTPATPASIPYSSSSSRVVSSSALHSLSSSNISNSSRSNGKGESM